MEYRLFNFMSNNAVPFSCWLWCIFALPTVIPALLFVFSCPHFLALFFYLLSMYSTVARLLSIFFLLSHVNSWRVPLHFVSVSVSAFVPLRLFVPANDCHSICNNVVFLAPSFQFPCWRLFHSFFNPAKGCHSKSSPAQPTCSTVLDTCCYYCCLSVGFCNGNLVVASIALIIQLFLLCTSLRQK